MAMMMRFEWKKIFERRLNVAAMLLGYILIAVCVFAYISQADFYDGETDSYVKGIEGIRRAQERDNAQTDEITDAYITELIRQIQSYGLDLESDEAYMKITRHMGDIFYFTARNYTDMRESIADRNALMEPALADGAHFYEQRMKKITDYLNCDFSYGNYTEAEKEYWIRKAQNTTVPFRWGGYNIMSIVEDTVEIGFYLLFVIVICVSPLFSAEYESGAATLLLTTRHGKKRLVQSKILVALLFTIGYPAVGLLAAVGIIGLLLGFDGAGLPVQLWNSVIPYNMTMVQACVATFAVIALISVAVALVLLCCSARLRSSLATLVIGIAIIIAPAFFPMSRESGLWNHINYLFPARAMNLKDVLRTYVSYGAGNLVIPYVGMIVLVYAVVGAVALPLIRRGFVKLR
ncbi:MAG: ABC transporter permease subunit [Roseburia sp.]|nr:ABC transporter permease subunit [Roseburia sp.]